MYRTASFSVLVGSLSFVVQLSHFNLPIFTLSIFSSYRTGRNASFVTDNYIGYEGARALADALLTNTTVTSITLECMYRTASFSVLVGSLSFAVQLTHFNLPYFRPFPSLSPIGLAVMLRFSQVMKSAMK